MPAIDNRRFLTELQKTRLSNWIQVSLKPSYDKLPPIAKSWGKLAQKATVELGFVITEANLKGVCKNIGWMPELTKKPSNKPSNKPSTKPTKKTPKVPYDPENEWDNIPVEDNSSKKPVEKSPTSSIDEQIRSLDKVIEDLENEERFEKMLFSYQGRLRKTYATVRAALLDISPEDRMVLTEMILSEIQHEPIQVVPKGIAIAPEPQRVVNVPISGRVGTVAGVSTVTNPQWNGPTDFANSSVHTPGTGSPPDSGDSDEMSEEYIR